jgi:putative addiction module component (TIGR02574 family)
MSSVDDAFLAAQSLGPEEKLELISRIMESIPSKSDFRPSDADMAEIQRRSAELDAGLVKTIPWEVVRDSVRERLRSHHES